MYSCLLLEKRTSKRKRLHSERWENVLIWTILILSTFQLYHTKIPQTWIHSLCHEFEFELLVFNATFSNISAIPWQPVLVVEGAEYSERPTDPEQATGKLYHLRLRVECTLFCNLQSWARTHAVLVIGLNELLDPTT